MPEQSVEVVVQIAGANVPAGRLWAHSHGHSESATFAYNPEFLGRSDSYKLDPVLAHHTGQQQTPDGQALFGGFSDAAPDGWGRRLVRRSELHYAREQGRTERSVAEIDYLLAVRDDLRQGALRFRRDAQSGYLARERQGVPHLIDLPRLLDAAEQLERDEASNEDLQILLEGGSSLGGARPKAHVIDREGRLGIAKFPAPEGDDWDVIRWESVALTLAHAAGIRVPRFELHAVLGRPVLIVRRFDRDERGRIGYVSAMTMLEASDGTQGSYVEIAETVEEHSPKAIADLRELWRRIVFSILISNTDDHLRNHGFLRLSTAGWTLSPAFDLNPNPRRKEFATALEQGRARSDLASALELAGLFRLEPDDARAIVAEVSDATSRWREMATRHGLAAAAIEQHEPAFEHEQAEVARQIATAAARLG
jgi:serine/threonine-protein kinase HipA